MRPLRTPLRQRGMSLVELMVGIAVGLIIVAAATVMAATQLVENRRLLLETQVQQDMRVTMDVMTRELRRAGHVRNVNIVWTAAEADREPAVNDFTGPVITASDRIQFSYLRPAPTSGDPNYAFFLRDGVIYSQNGTNAAEPMTDSNVMLVTGLVFERLPAGGTAPLVEALTCPTLCTGDTEDCWPQFTLHDIQITMTARSVSDPNVQRTMETRVRPRNDSTRHGTGMSRYCPP